MVTPVGTKLMVALSGGPSSMLMLQQYDSFMRIGHQKRHLELIVVHIDERQLLKPTIVYKNCEMW